MEVAVGKGAEEHAHAQEDRKRRRSQVQQQPPPRFPVLLRNPQCTGCIAVFPNGGALAAHLEETAQCRKAHGENQLHALMGGDDHGGHAFEG